MTALVILAALLSANPAEHIAYISVDAAGGSTLQCVDVTTHASRHLADHPVIDTPAWSPEGERVAWVSAGDGAVHITPIGDGAEQVLPGSIAAHPRWHSSGMQIAVSQRPGPEAPPIVMVHDLDTGDVTPWGGEMGRNIGGLTVQGLMLPEWLPSGRLVLALDPEQKLETEGVDMAQLRIEAEITEEALRANTPPQALLALALVFAHDRLTTEPVLVTRSQILPILLLPVFEDAGASLRFSEWNLRPNRDGERVALETNQGGDREIHLLSRIGLTNISNHHAADQNPVWGDDRRALLFESFRNGRRGVYHAIADTALVTPVIAPESSAAWSPCWSPDGDSLAYIADGTGTPELYVSGIKGNNIKQLTAHPPGGMAIAPAWQPETQ